MVTATELVQLCQRYQQALRLIRDNEVPFTKTWRIANNALQRADKQQLELFQGTAEG